MVFSAIRTTLIAPLHSYMNRHYGESRCSFQTLEGRSSISYYAALLNVITSAFLYYDQSRPLCLCLDAGWYDDAPTLLLFIEICGWSLLDGHIYSVI